MGLKSVLRSLVGLFAISLASSRPGKNEPTVTKVAARDYVPSGGGPNLFSSSPWTGRKKNQRQYRKTCRHNPSMYGSKKHRSKN